MLLCAIAVGKALEFHWPCQLVPNSFSFGRHVDVAGPSDTPPALNFQVTMRCPLHPFGWTMWHGKGRARKPGNGGGELVWPSDGGSSEPWAADSNRRTLALLHLICTALAALAVGLKSPELV